jgi:hypothetical protein
MIQFRVRGPREEQRRAAVVDKERDIPFSCIQNSGLMES